MKLVGFIKELDRYTWASPLCDELWVENNSEEPTSVFKDR